MSLLTVITLILRVADSLMGLLQEKQLLEAGQAMAEGKNAKKALEIYKAAQAARDAVADRIHANPDWLPVDDPNRRD